MPSLAGSIATLYFLLSGCGFMMIGPPVEKIDLSSQDDAEENLKAIRAILADETRRSAPFSDKPFDEPLTPLPPTESKPLSEPHSAVAVVTFSASAARTPSAPARLPWTPPKVSRFNSSTPPDRPVPAYTIPAPVVPGYMGTIHCVPDGMGGQRCLGR